MRFSTFPSAFPGCAVPSAGNQPANHPAPAFSQPPAPTPSVVAPMRFSAPRASIGFHCVRLETSPTRVIRRRLHFSGRRTGPASGSYRSLAGTFGPGNAHGICSYPSQYCSASRAERVFRRLDPTCRFARRRPRVSSSRDPLFRAYHRSRAAASGVDHAKQPCRAICRPRHGFYAQGRSNSPAVTALGLSSSLRSSPPASGLHLWSHPPMGLCAIHTPRLQVITARIRARPSAYRGADGQPIRWCFHPHRRTCLKFLHRPRAIADSHRRGVLMGLF